VFFDDFVDLFHEANCERAASKSSTISAAMTSGGGRLALSSRLSSLSQSRAAGKRARQTGRPRDRLSGSEGVNMSRFSVESPAVASHPLRVALGELFVGEALEAVGFFSIVAIIWIVTGDP